MEERGKQNNLICCNSGDPQGRGGEKLLCLSKHDIKSDKEQPSPYAVLKPGLKIYIVWGLKDFKADNPKDLAPSL